MSEGYGPGNLALLLMSFIGPVISAADVTAAELRFSTNSGKVDENGRERMEISI
jgi:hypothetical protein